MKIPEGMNINLAIKIMKEEVKNPYAQSYLNALSDAVSDHGTDGLITQLMYILDNCRSWRGPKAKQVKDFVKDWIKQKEKSNGKI
jgi:hypothetical protein